MTTDFEGKVALVTGGTDTAKSNANPGDQSERRVAESEA
jgi:hypothetical protein